MKTVIIMTIITFITMTIIIIMIMTMMTSVTVICQNQKPMAMMTINNVI